MFAIGCIDNFGVGLGLEGEVKISIFENRFLILGLEMFLIDDIIDDNFAINDDFDFETSSVGDKLTKV